MYKIYRYSNYKSNPYGHGGDKRTAQISELLEMNGIEWEIIPSGFNPTSFSFYYISKCVNAIANFTKVLFIIKKVCHPLTMYRTIWLVTHFKGVFSIPRTKGDQIIIWEATKMDFSFIVPLFLKKGYSIIGIPHNIESLIPFQKSAITNRITPNWILEEIRILKKCHQVFTISKEETIFLNQCGINAKYLPYFPPKEIYENLLTVRKNREKLVKSSTKIKKILLLGSAVNPPTREGMINRINFFNQINNPLFEITVAGFGTEQLESMLMQKGSIRFLGELSYSQLIETLSEIDVLLVHQPAASGALTRIIESLIAGVPVLANIVSARNYFGTDGVYVYNSDEQMVNYLAKDFSMPLIPERPVIEIESFIMTLRKTNEFN
jgi:glycosyltransferase involved in cell wall biosynthesis